MASWKGSSLKRGDRVEIVDSGLYVPFVGSKGTVVEVGWPWKAFRYRVRTDELRQGGTFTLGFRAENLRKLDEEGEP